MRMKNSVSILSLMLILTTGCVRDELALPGRQPGSAVVRELCLESGYENQLWFDIGTGSVMASNDKTAWDLSFECGQDGWRVRLNGSRMMWAWDRGAVPMDQPTDTLGMGAARKYDRPSGHADSTAIGDWRNGDHVFIIDMGTDQQGASMGMRKLQVLSVDASGYVVSTAQLDGSDPAQYTVAKDPLRAHTMFKFEQGATVIEPVHRTWDIVLTRYTTQVYQPIYLPYYQVTGFLAGGGTRLARMENPDFNAVALSDTLQHAFSSDRDVIGYDWKTYSFITNSYTVDPSIVYIINDAEGYFHKLRFLDYYNQVGDIGCPRFEVVTF